MPPRAAPQGFVGQATSLQFLATLPPHLGLGGTHLFRLYLAAEADGAALCLSWQPYRPDALLDDATTTRRVLLDGVQGLSIRNFGAAAVGQAAGWGDSWQVAGRLPLLIAIDVAFDGDQPRPWPSLVIAPALAGGAAP